MPVLLVIPARYASTRYPGKPLVELARRDRRGAQPDPPQLGGGDRGAGRRPGGGRHRRRPHRRGRPRLRRRGGDDPGRPAATAPSAAPWWPATSAAAHDIVVNLQGDAPLTPALVRLGADRGDAGGPRAPGRDPGAALRRRGARGLPRGPPPRPRRRHHRRLRPRRAARSTSPRRCIPYTGRPLGRRRGDPGLPPCRRLRLPPRGARTPIPTGRWARSRPGRASSSCASWRTASRCTASRSRRAAAPSGSSTIPSDVPRIEAILRRARPAVTPRHATAVKAVSNCDFECAAIVLRNSVIADMHRAERTRRSRVDGVD